MAKKRSDFFRISGTLLGITHVESNAYDPHVRARRGTYKEARLNGPMKESCIHLESANIPAKIIKDALNPFLQNFKDGRLWSRLVAHFKQEIRWDHCIDFRKLEGFEMHRVNTLGRVVNVRAEIVPDTAQSIINIDLEHSCPDFKGIENIEGFGATLICIYPDLAAKTAVTESCALPIRPLKNETFRGTHTLPMPAEAATVILCVKFEGYLKDNALSNNSRTKGMKIIKAVDIIRTTP